MSNSEDTIIIPKFTKEDYHIPEPRRPALDSRAWCLMMPAVMGVVGLGAFALLAYTFKELDLIGQTIRSHIVLWGATSLAVGGEVGTIATNLEIFRKVRQGQATKWDWLGLATSMLATVLAFLLAAARLLGADVVWSDFVKTWGQIVLILVSALDQYAGQMELGLYIGSYDTRHEKWENDYHSWLDRMAMMYGVGSKDALLNGHQSTSTHSEQLEEEVMQLQEEIAALKQSPVHMPNRVLPARRNGNGGKYDEFINENGDGTCTVACPCGWTGKRRNQVYRSKAGAANAVQSHRRTCDVELVHPWDGQVEEENGDF